MLRFKSLVVQDRLLGEEACRLLVPADWQASGRVDWRFHPQYPASISIGASNPYGVEAVYSYPMVPFVAGVLHLPPGAYYLGNECRPYPRDILGYVRLYLLPRYRPEIHAYRIVGSETLAGWASTSLMGQAASRLHIPYQVQAGRVRIAYRLNGRDVEEEFNVMLDSLHMVGLHTWGAEWATSVRAAPGQLDPVRRIHQTMISSFRLSLPWYSRERQAAAACTQMIRNEQAAIMRISHILTQTNDHITAVIRTSYESRQAALDRCHARFSEYIRGVQTYRGLDGHPIELPSGYRHAWVNNRGEYLLSDDVNFNPNVRLHGDWHELHSTR